ncbi:MAG TPA: AAA family ATPase, partial [Candidatus Sulfomarinibacteraceae bacterium]|nr:AAA family ATPase [Candidatus Sulfomarinibacteraceae bacterium]
MPEYPVQINKVQAPPLRDETLERVRLLDWLHVKIHRRVVLVTAEAGYGKTTLLSDFTRRSRVRTLWFRLDRGDRDWIGFIAYLIAAVRIHLPEFAPIAHAMLRENGGSGPPRDAVLDTFIRELGALPQDPTAFVLDDFHAVDDSVDVRHILRELLARAPERLTFVLISRKVPPLPFARLRALGEVAELRTSDLRFDPGETEQLFRTTYAIPLEPSVVAELSRRTEGWAASLQLVRTAIRDRTPSEIRAFIGSLSGAEGELYDYLAEEVIGELPQDLQQFLMRTSILEMVEPILGSVAAETTPEATRQAIADGELVGLFSRTSPQIGDQVRAHPLVRDFLHSRLVRSVGPETVAAIHRAVAVEGEPIDWRIASHHYVAAGDLGDARRVLANAITSILASGAYADAETLVTVLPRLDGVDPNVLVVLSRLAQQRGHAGEGLELAEAAFRAEPHMPAVLLNLITARVQAGNIEGALDLAQVLEKATTGRTSIALIARAFRLMMGCSVDGDLTVASLAIEALIPLLRSQAELHFLGVALTNLAYIRNAEGRNEEALEAATEAVAHLRDTSAGIELVSAYLACGWARVYRGDMEGARSEVALARKSAPGGQALEVAFEAGEIEVMYGDPQRASDLLDGLADLDPATDLGEHLTLLRIQASLALGRIDEACSLIRHLSHGVPRSSVSFEAKRLYVEALGLWLSGNVEAAARAEAARSLAVAQRSNVLAQATRLLADATQGRPLDDAIVAGAAFHPAILSIAAEVIVRHLGSLG